MFILGYRPIAAFISFGLIKYHNMRAAFYNGCGVFYVLIREHQIFIAYDVVKVGEQHHCANTKLPLALPILKIQAMNFQHAFNNRQHHQRS
jgi:hypothetical protein